MDDGGTLPSSISPWHDPSQERYSNRWLVKLFLQRQKSLFLQSAPPRLLTIWSKRIGNHLFFFCVFKWSIANHRHLTHVNVNKFDPVSFRCCSTGPLPSAMKVRGGSPYSHYEMLGSDSLGIPTQGAADNWHRSPGSKMGNKPAASSWPPGEHVFLSSIIWSNICFLLGFKLIC